MGIHVTRSGRAATPRLSFRRAGEVNRPAKLRPGKSGSSGGAQGGPKTGGGPGTRGDFGEDVE